MTEQVFQDEEALAASLAARLLASIRFAPALVLGLPTGRTPVLLYRELVRRTREDNVDWSQVRTFNIDEFVGCGRGDAGSFRSYMDTHLFGEVNLTPGHIHFLDGRAADLEAECRRYETSLQAVGGIDVLVLGLGPNGHIGFNEPADALTAVTHRVVLEEGTRIANAGLLGGEVTRVPREALTMGMRALLGAKTIFLLVTGAEKAPVVRALRNSAITTRLPASFLHLHPRTTLLMDEAAAA